MKMKDMISVDGKVEVYALGIVCCSVCADKSLTSDQVAEVVNSIAPTGISSAWQLSKDEFFRGGAKNGCDCEDAPARRRHWLLEC